MRMTIFAITVALLFASCVTTGDDESPSPVVEPVTPVTTPGALPAIDLSYNGGVLIVEVARTAEERSKGFGGRASLTPDAGMLFDLGETRVPSFSMRDTLIPLDFIWITEDRRIQGIVADVQPLAPGETLTPYSPTEPVRYVLEVNGGTAARLGMQSGDQLEFELP